MIIGYGISVQDDDSYMLGEDSFKPKDNGGFYDWRFGKDGMPHPATCKTCGSKINPDYVNAAYRVLKRKRDITFTYDGYTLVSNRLRDYLREHNYPGVELITLPNDKDFYWLRSNRTIKFDIERRGTRFEKFCNTCGNYFNVIGAIPIYIKEANETLPDGFYRTDIEFGSGHEQHPIIVVGPKTGEQLRLMKFIGLELRAIER